MDNTSSRNSGERHKQEWPIEMHKVTCSGKVVLKIFVPIKKRSSITAHHTRYMKLIDCSRPQELLVSMVVYGRKFRRQFFSIPI